MFLRLFLLLATGIFHCNINASDSFSLPLLVSTASDPDAIVEKCVNVINGDYCEAVTDLIIPGPDPLILQRFHNSKNYVTGQGNGGWRILPQMLLVLGKDPAKKECKVGGDRFEWTYAFTGERSGSILTYSGWKRINGDTKDPLKISGQKDAMGLVNTYAEEINGKTNHLNNRLSVQGDTCILTLGDGTKRLFEKTLIPPITPFCNLHKELSAKVLQPIYYRLVSETFPSGNTLFFFYNDSGELSQIEIQSKAQKLHSWVDFNIKGNTLSLTTSDSRTLQYKFDNSMLKEVTGSHSIPTSYEYNKAGALVRKCLPEGRYLEIEYDTQGKVSALKKPHPETGKSFIAKRFQYGSGFTDVWNALQVKTRYHFDQRSQLTSLAYFNETGSLYRSDRKYYGTNKETTLLIARTVADGSGKIFSYRSFKYDETGNVIEEKLYGNLTGKEDPNLIVDTNSILLNSDEADCHTKTFTYSKDGFNLLTSLGDCKGNRTTYHYQPGSNLLIKKLIHDAKNIRNREFRFYNEDGVCTKVIEDDGAEDIPQDIYRAKERRITYFQSKLVLPGIGLPEIIEEKALDFDSNQEISIKTLVNTYSPQGHLLSCSTYGSDGVLGYTTLKTYNNLGLPLAETYPEGKTITHSYNNNGELVLTKVPHEHKTVERKYDLLGRLISHTEKAGSLTAQENYTYDLSNRKISSKDRFGYVTSYEYDAFDRLKKVTYPTVLDEYENKVNPSFTYEYDLFGNPITITDPKGDVTQKTYNLRGSPARIYYPDGSSELFKYDPEGSLHRSLTRDRLITIYEYDYLGRPTYEEVMTTSDEGASGFYKSRTRTYNGFHCTSFREDQLMTEYTFDPIGRMIQIAQYPSGDESEARIMEISYDSLSRKIQEKKGHSITSFTYDTMGNLLRTTIEDDNGTVLKEKHFSYDQAGRCIEESDCQTTLKTEYDPFGEPIAYIDTAGHKTEIFIDYGTSLKKMIRNPLGLTTEMKYDALGRVVSLIKKDPKGQLLSSQEILYDTLGNKCVEKNGVIAQITRWIYGPMGRLDQLIEGEEKITSYNYNTKGQLISQTFSGVKNPLTFTYNQQGHLYKVKYKDPDDKHHCITNTYSYNRQGYITSAHALHGVSVEREVNVFGDVLKETIDDGKGEYSLSYQYDLLGRLTNIELPDHSSISYTYDALFQKEVIRFKNNGTESYRHLYSSYDTSGRLCTENLIGYCGERTTSYESGQKSSIQTDFSSETRTYDALGHLLTVNDSSYSYNSLSQLVKEDNNSHSYDSLDNRIKENNETLIYNSLNQLIRKGKLECSYDPLGNLDRKILDNEETLFTHNILSQLIAVKKADKTALYFTYDPFGRRLTKKQCNISGKYKKTLSLSRSFYLGNHELGELDRDGRITKLKIPGVGSQSVAIELNGNPYVLLHDHAGNVVALVEPESREIVESYCYSAFGIETLYASDGLQLKRSLVDNPWRFAEKRIDDETGLIYFGVRYYDPALGRWISQDPSGKDGPNPYAYLHNNPINYIDYVGFETEEFEEYYYNDVEKHCYCEKHRSCKRGGDLDKTVNGLPTVTYCDNFERPGPFPVVPTFYKPSSISQTGGLVTENIGIGFINGIWNTFESAEENAQYLFRLSGGYNVHFVHNATHGMQDIREYNMGRRHIATEPVRQLHCMWNSFFEKSSATAKFLMVCHSQGATHVMNALLDYPSELRERISVVAVAPGSYIYQETCAQVTHYRNKDAWRDFIPRLDWAGAARSRETIVDLASHRDAKWFDHGFQSLTYLANLKLQLEKFLK